MALEKDLASLPSPPSTSLPGGRVVSEVILVTWSSRIRIMMGRDARAGLSTSIELRALKFSTLVLVGTSKHRRVSSSSTHLRCWPWMETEFFSCSQGPSSGDQLHADIAVSTRHVPREIKAAGSWDSPAGDGTHAAGVPHCGAASTAQALVLSLCDLISGCSF